MAAATNQRLEVELQVCPKCDRIGKHPDGQYKGFCVGPVSEKHRRVRTETRRFREVVA